MEKPQHRRRDRNAIVHQRGRLLGLKRMPVVLDPATFLPHLNLPVHHTLIKPQMALRSEQSIPQVHALHRCVLRARPHAQLVRGLQQRRRLVRGNHGHLVLVHLVQVDDGLFGAEQVLAHVRELHGGVRQLPAAGGSRAHGAAEHAAEDLVAEADAGEAHVRARLPELLQEGDELEDPGGVGVRVVHAAGDDDGARVLGDLVDGGDVAWVLAIFHDVVHVCFDSEGRVVRVAGLLEELVEDVAEAAAALHCFRVRGVGLEDEHADGVAAHCGEYRAFAAEEGSPGREGQ